MGGKKFYCVVAVILPFVCTILILIQFVTYGNMYNLDDEKILSDYPEVHHTMLYSSSVLDHKELKASMFLLCGNTSICYLTSTQKATVELSFDRNWGKGKLLLKNQENGQISSVPLDNGEADIEIDTGKYHVFLVGKWLNGNLTLKSDDILFHTE